MSHMIELSDRQFDELNTLLQRELRESKDELRHTWDADYKQRVRRHIAMIEQMIRDVAASACGADHDVVAG